MKQKISVLALMSLSLAAATAGVNDQITILKRDNPLYPYSLSKKGEVLNTFEVPFSALSLYYSYATDNLIVENKTAIELLDFNYIPIQGLTKDQLTFTIDLRKQKATPLQALAPDTIHKLFIYDSVQFVEDNNAIDFSDAKRSYFNNIHFAKKSLRYDREIIHLSDWRSLPHPPIMELDNNNLAFWDKNFHKIDYTQAESQYFSEDFHKNIDSISGTELTFGNKLELLMNNQSYKKKLELVRGAKEHVHIAVMSFLCDKSSKELENALIQKAQEGIDVKLMVERVWTKLAMMKCYNRMKKGGVDVLMAKDFMKSGEDKALFHNKFWIIDRNKAIVGGMNIIEGDNASTGFNHQNRDTDVFIQGPIATDAMREYIRLWKKFETKRIVKKKDKKYPGRERIEKYIKIYQEQIILERNQNIRGAAAYEKKLNNINTRMDGACRLVIQAPDTDKYRLTKTFKAYIDAAKSDLYLTTGSIMFRHPDHSDKEQQRETWNKKLFDSVFAAADRGIKVDLIANGIDGGYGELSSKLRGIANRKRAKSKYGQEKLWEWFAHKADKSAAKGNYPYLYEVQKRENMNAWAIFQYMHSKLIYMDRTAMMIGSYNLEEWSADKSHEVAVLCQDEKLNAQADYGFVSDITNSVPVTLEYADKLLQRVSELTEAPVKETKKVLRVIRQDIKPGRTNF